MIAVRLGTQRLLDVVGVGLEAEPGLRLYLVGTDEYLKIFEDVGVKLGFI